MLIIDYIQISNIYEAKFRGYVNKAHTFIITAF